MGKRAETVVEIKRVARAQMAADGAAGLSLGAIARRMGVTTPALYRYFDNRDDLVTALIVDAYHALADALETAVADLPADAFGERFRRLLDAYREWAVAHPEDYTLVHGAPLSGYEPPPETRPAAVRSLRLIGAFFVAAHEAHRLHIPAAYLRPSDALAEALTALQHTLRQEAIPQPILTLTLLVWMRLHALVWQELNGHLPPELTADGRMYALEVEAITMQLGLAG